MATQAADLSTELPCHRCGYDLRAHPPDGVCPECGASVAEAKRLATIPRRPTWRNSDPRWRRRMLAGVWILVFLPLMVVLQATGWSAAVPVPSFFRAYHTVNTLDDTLLTWIGVYESIVFCIGIVLLFARERGRRDAPLDWTRRWGVLSSYVVFLLRALDVLFIVALVAVGISALFLSMPPIYQPGVTQLFVDASTTYLRYGPHPGIVSLAASAAFSAIAILLACVPLYHALRSVGPRWAAILLLAPLAIFAGVHLVQAVGSAFGFGTMSWATNVDPSYFRPGLLLAYITGDPTGILAPMLGPGSALVEAIKFASILAIATWLTIAQTSTWRRRGAAEARSVTTDA